MWIRSKPAASQTASFIRSRRRASGRRWLASSNSTAKSGMYVPASQTTKSKWTRVAVPLLTGDGRRPPPDYLAELDPGKDQRAPARENLLEHCPGPPLGRCQQRATPVRAVRRTIGHGHALRLPSSRPRVAHADRQSGRCDCIRQHQGPGRIGVPGMLAGAGRAYLAQRRQRNLAGYTGGPRQVHPGSIRLRRQATGRPGHPARNPPRRLVINARLRPSLQHKFRMFMNPLAIGLDLCHDWSRP